VTHPGSDETRVLRASRFKWAVLLLAGAVFAMGGVLVFFAAPGGRVGGIVVFVFFGGCAAVAATQLVLRSTLTLTTDGFTFTSLGRRVTRRWQDVDSFVAVRTSALSGVVGIRLAISSERLSGPRRAAMAIAGYDGGALPDTYGMKADDLAALMNDWRGRYRNST
jgi:hypothetical protein